jgi:RimJ/RimL family protein N-acetyltransferase
VADAHAYIAAVAMRRLPTTLGIVVEGEVAGTISLVLGDDVARATAEIGYWVGRRIWGRGVATDAVHAMTTHGFSTLGLRRIFAVPFAWNPASARVLERAGYVLEGRLRRSALKDGEIVDQWLYAAYDDRWPPSSP